MKSDSDWSRKNRRSRSKSQSQSRSRSRQLKQKEYSKPQYEVMKSLSIEHAFDHSLVSQKFDSLSIRIGTSLPDEIQVIHNQTLIRYPSTDATLKIMNEIKGQIEIDKKNYKVNYFPKRQIQLQDWHCEKCSYINYARRNKCNRCDNYRNSSCKPAYKYASETNNSNTQSTENRDEINYCSLMLRGAVITWVQQTLLINIFENFGSLKDIRMIKNRMTGLNKDFAFIQYHTPEQAAKAFREANQPGFKIQGQPISCRYSKNRKQQAHGHFKDDYLYPRETKPVPKQNYFQKQREKQIKEEREREKITFQQLKQRKQLQSKRVFVNMAYKQSSKDRFKKKQQVQEIVNSDKHMKTHTLINEIMYICPLCVRKFKDEQELKNHEERSALHKRMYDQLVV